MKKLFENKNIFIPISLLLMLLIAYLTAGRYFDNDGYWIISTGKYIVENGIPKINPFTNVNNLQTIIQQWPWTIFCYEVYTHFGRVGLYISCLINLLINIVLIAKLAKLKESDSKLSVIFSLFMFGICFAFVSVRPTLPTFFLLLSEIYVLEHYKKTGKKQSLLFLILISFAEINFHSSLWFMHFVFMLPYIVPPIKNPFVEFNEDDMKRKPLFLTMIPMFLVGFLNPYGIKGMLYIVYSFGDKLKNAGILELDSFTLKSFYGLLIMFTIVIVLHILNDWKHKEISIEASSFYIFCGTIIMSIGYIRNLVYFVFGLIIIFIELISYIDLDKFDKWIENQMKYTCLLGYVCFIGAISVFGVKITNELKVDEYHMEGVPTQIVQYLDKNKVDKDTKIYTDFNTGGYFEFNGYKCFVDARPELFFKKLNKKQEVFDDYLKLNSTADVKKIEKLLDKYQFEYICTNKDYTLDFYLKTSNKYKLVQKDKNSDYLLYQKIK